MQCPCPGTLVMHLGSCLQTSLSPEGDPDSVTQWVVSQLSSAECLQAFHTSDKPALIP